MLKNIDDEIISQFYSGIHIIIKKAIRQSNKQLSKQQLIIDLKNLGLVINAVFVANFQLII